MRWFIPAVLLLPILSSPLLASPCTNNNWQPTFVHDLENEDGPWYVTSGMSFIQLRWVPEGGYVPHACELVPGPQATRNRRGFTTCREYTRIQCGCSRSIPGNDTCAAFLAWHTQKVAPPGPGAGPGPAPGPAPGAQPGSTQTPPQQSVITVPGSAFQQAAQYRPGLSAQANSLILRGGKWTNGRLANGFYDGNRVFSSQTFDFSTGGDAYMRIAVNGGGKYMVFWPRVLEGVSVPPMSTDHSWANSIVVRQNETIFAHVHVEPGGAYRVAVARGGYDDQGGQIIASNAGQLANPRTRLDLQFGDNYAGEAASLTIAEAIVRAGGATAGGARSQPAGSGPAPARGGRPGGASCSSEADCASSICLLGVCAPAN